ncbi:hypothetical protein EUGRSUZ_D02426 [Eucalyptus grandis]|uniref:Uncharacterized protein n=1 Tax=Eucalyptus grandis TaxID=71139 RepID=A0A059CIE6_EUCGR|nr:hypothetical protein EUGRSUZ_D02426 [Eucalyptus grandis]
MKRAFPSKLTNIVIPLISTLTIVHAFVSSLLVKLKQKRLVHYLIIAEQRNRTKSCTTRGISLWEKMG